MKTRVFDNKGETLDQYTIFNDDQVTKWFECLLLSHNCDSPQGMCMYDSYHYNHIAHGHRGEEIAFTDLPDNVQKHVKRLSFPVHN